MLISSHTIDMPYLLSKTHTMKRRVVTVTQMWDPDVSEPIEPSPLQNIYSSLSDSSPDIHVLIITGVKWHEAFAKKQLVQLFSRPPYELVVVKFLLKDEAAYMTFTDPQGIMT